MILDFFNEVQKIFREKPGRLSWKIKLVLVKYPKRALKIQK